MNNHSAADSSHLSKLGPRRNHRHGTLREIDGSPPRQETDLDEDLFPNKNTDLLFVTTNFGLASYSNDSSKPTAPSDRQSLTNYHSKQATSPDSNREFSLFNRRYSNRDLELNESGLSTTQSSNRRQGREESMIIGDQEEKQQETTCQTNKAPVRIEIKTDTSPSPARTISWDVTDIQVDKAVLSSSSLEYSSPNTKYVTTRCIDSSRTCFHFAIHYFSGDGTCCSAGGGIEWFKVIYNNHVVLEGDEFQSTAALLFGDGCGGNSHQVQSQNSLPKTPSISLSAAESTLSLTRTSSSILSVTPSPVSFFLPTKVNNDGSNFQTSLPSSRKPSHFVVIGRHISVSSGFVPNDGGTTSELASSLHQFVLAATTSSPSSAALRKSSEAQTREPISCSENDKVDIRVEIQTDRYPKETSWRLNFWSSALSVASKEKIYTEKSTLYVETIALCVDSSTSCFNFVIKDSAGDGLCCNYGDGWYKVSYNNILVAEGDEFEGSETSTLFGTGCPLPSLSPSTLPSNIPTVSYVPTSSIPPSNHPSNILSNFPSSSLSPSLSLSPTVEPSQFPTAPPSVTASPSSKPSKSLSPTTSEIPTATPTNKPQAFIAVDETNRRYFPRQPIRPQSAFSSQLVPDCTALASEERVGCIGTTRAFTAKAPVWAGDLYYKPPRCMSNKDGSRCEMNIPMSRNTLRNTIPRPRQETRLDLLELPGGDVDTNSIAVADINGDGLIDIIMGNKFAKNRVLFYRGNRSVSQTIDLPGDETDTSSIAVADIDGDGKIDIIVGNVGAKNQVLFNQGDALFSEVLDLPGAGDIATRSIAVADVDDDGMIDIIVGNAGAKNQVFFNQGGGLVFDAIDLPGSGIRTSSIAVADINGDGRIDIIVGNEDEDNEIILNQGGKSFSEEAIVLPGGDHATYSIAVADIDGDGRIDVVVGNDLEENQVLFNHGGESLFSTAISLLGGFMETRSIALADVNGDGMIDIVVGNDRNDINQVFLNQGDGSFQDGIDLQRGEVNTRSIAVADMDGNGKGVDIIVGNESPQDIQIFFNRGFEGVFNAAIDLPGGDMSTRSIAVADINGDGMLDIIVGNHRQYNQILLNVGDGSYNEAIGLLATDSMAASSIAVADINGDGTSDIIFGNIIGANRIFLNRGDGLLYDVIDLPGGNTVTWSIAIADVDGDGEVDIIVGNRAEYNQILLNHGDGIFTEAINLPGSIDMSTYSVSVADLNGDEMIDIIVGNNFGTINQVLLNDGSGSFNDVIKLPGGEMSTRSIAVADIDGDGTVDIIVGNYGGTNQLLLNRHGNGTYSEAIDLPGGRRNTGQVTVADINGDGQVDIIMGNHQQANQVLMNLGGGIFSEEATTDLVIDDRFSSDSSYAVVVADIDGDGVLEVVFGNYSGKNHLFYFFSCPSGGAQLHEASWCFDCPSFMGHQVLASGFQKRSICKECLPDDVQNQDGNNQVCTQCLLGERRDFGDDSCVPCTGGTYYDSLLERKESNSSTWREKRCKECPAGEYSNSQLTAIDECFKCPPGAHQSIPGSEGCDICEEGQYQPEQGQPSCLSCARGGYCNATSVPGGGYVPCPPGTYNDRFGMSTLASCLECPKGTYSIETGAISSDSCRPCPKGTFGNETGQTRCHSCPIGTFQNSTEQSTCMECPPTSYADKPGLFDCIKCPHRLDSTEGNDICSLCSQEFYLKDTFISGDAIFQNPFENCLTCPMPSNETCPSKNTTLQTLNVPPGYWRATAYTSRIYKCSINEKLCTGGNTPGQYCEDGHKGPLCEVCVDQEESYFNRVTGICLTCPSWSRMAIQSSLFILALFLYFGIATLVPRRLAAIKAFTSRLSPQAKLKIFVSFYQVVSSLEVVYGVKLSSDFQSWLIMFQIFSLDIFDLIGWPKSCIGSMKQQLVANAVWPYILIFLAILGVCSRLLYKIRRQQSIAYSQVLQRNRLSTGGSSAGDTLRNLIEAGAYHFTYVSVVVLYFALPTVSLGIFDAIKCRAFKIRDDGEEYKSYLLVDMDIECDANSDGEFGDIQTVFWIFFVLWPVLTPLGLLALLVVTRKSIRSNRITPLAAACRFLWNDYDESVWFWDVIDMWRKIFLSGCIMFIDREEGSTKLLRLAIASVVSGAFLGFLAISRPYKKKHDLYLDFVSNLLLLCCFVFGIILQLCDEESDNDGSCNRFIGLKLDSYRASGIIFALIVGMLTITIGFLVVLTKNTIQLPTVLLASGHSPNLEMTEDCNYHAFMSHVWSSGQAKTHAIMRNLLLHLPKLKIWLDINDLEDITKLEEYVAEAAVFILFYSDGYFRSRNCRREIYTAARLGKPIIVLYEGDDSVIEALYAECNEYCAEPESPGPSTILQCMFPENTSEKSKDNVLPPILWLDQSVFCAAALNKIYLRILSHLPYYQKNPLLLNDGIIVPGEIGPLKLNCEVDILVCGANYGSEELAKEMQSSLSDIEIPLMNIVDTEEYFEQHSNDNSEVPIALGGREEEGTAVTVLLLYLNQDFFAGGEEIALKNVIQSCTINPNISIVLVHEQDIAKGGCPFGLFFHQVPQDLIDPPCKIFGDIAIPLYSIEEYRAISFKQIIYQFGKFASKANKGMRNRRRRLLPQSLRKVRA